jgi:hypothetical protein
MEQFSRQIDGARDFELGIERTSKITYHCTRPPARAKGLIFVVPGFGDDATAEYNRVLRRYLSARHSLVAVMVAYHASQSRPPAAGIELSRDDVHRVIGLLATRNIRIGFDPLQPGRLLPELNKLGIPLTIAAKLLPKNGDYQNFGVMQALDHLCVLNDVLDSRVDFDTDNILCLGSSHGAYIAHLFHKFAPNTINGIVDNSGYVIPVAQYLGSRPEFRYQVGNVTLNCNVVAKWDLADSYSPAYFGPARYAIRDAANRRHLAEIAAKTVRRCQFRMVNSGADDISRVEVKQAQLLALRAHGFDAQLSVISESQLDRKLFKSLEHGMDASLSGLFDLYAGSLAVRPTTLDRKLHTSLALECYDYVYRVRHHDAPPYFEASCERFEVGNPG